MKVIQVTLVLLVLCFFSAAGQQRNVLDNRDQLTIVKADSLNSDFQETNLCFSHDGKYLFFRSDRGGMPWSRYGRTYKSNCRADGDIYCSKIEDGIIHEAVCLPKGINNSDAQDEPSISSNGQTVIYQSLSRGWEYNDGPYYAARLNGMSWSDPVGLGGGINAFFVKQMDKYKKIATDGMCISPDGNTMIFACGPDYSSNLDLYRSKKNNGNWSYPEKLGISTDFDERTVFFTADGKYLFFASDRNNGSGGLDIYRVAVNNDGTFGQVENLGEPFNTKQDDYGFIMSPKGDEAYFVRDGDIYHAYFADTTPKPLPVDTVKVIRKDTVVRNFKPIHLDNSFVILFDYNKSDIKPIYFNDLRNLADSLKKDPALKMEVYGSTDSKGTEEFNLDLGFKRAKAVKQYITNLGVAPDRIFTLSFGKYRPYLPEGSGKDDANAAKNRRCEIWLK